MWKVRSLTRRSLLETLNGYLDEPWAEDYDLWFRAWIAGARFAKTSEVLLDWYDHPGRASRVQPRYSDASFLACKAHYLRQTVFADGQDCLLWGAGRVGKRLGRELETRGVRISRYVDIDPKKIGATRRGVPVVSPDAIQPAKNQVLLAAVGARGARELIRGHVMKLGFIEGGDFWCAA
ncbi:MAG: hypothetical protein AAFQ82_11845 [Myxococcota bacterium]